MPDKVKDLTQEEMDAVLYDAREGDLDTIKEIFEEVSEEALFTIKDEYTLSTTVHMAAGNGHAELVKYLLSLLPQKRAEELAALQNESGNTALSWSAFNGHIEVVKLLCEKYNVDPFIRNKAGHDAIYEAESKNEEEVSEFLLKRYAPEDQVEVKDEGENTKITYTPGNESRQTEAELAKMNTQELENKTDSLKIE